jgi:hypothetical protein
MNTEQNIESTTKKFSFLRFIKRFLLGALLVLITLLSFCVFIVYVYEDDVKALIIKELNKHLNSKITVEPQNIDLTIIKSFPKCALEFKNILALESKDFNTQDTLLYAKRLSLAFDVENLFNKNYTINKIELEDSKVNLKIDKLGKSNYIIWKTSDSSSSNDSLRFALEKIKLTNVFLSYKNINNKIKLSTKLNEVEFSGKFTESDYLLNVSGLAYIDLFQVQKVKYLNKKKLQLDVELDVSGSTFKIIKADTKINSTLLNSKGSFVIMDSLVSLDIIFKGNNLDISTTISLLPESFQNKINDYESDGTFYAEGECHYKAGTPLSVSSKFGIKQANIIYKKNSTKLSNVNLEGTILINENRSLLKLKNIKANLNSNTFVGNVEITNFNDPYIKLDVEANTNLEELSAFYQIDTLQNLSGSISLNANIECFINELKSNAFNPNIIANGTAKLLNIKTQFKHSEKEINIPEGEVKLTNRNLEVTNLKLIKGNSDVTIVGEMPNFLGYLFDMKSNLTINSTLTSSSIELENFIFSNNGDSKSTSVEIPSNLDLNLAVIINKLTFKKFESQQMSGSLFVKNQKVVVKDVTFLSMDGSISVNAFADASGSAIKISGDCEVSKINIKQLFFQLNNFGQTVLQDNHIKGFATASIDFTGTWDNALNVDLNTINATSSLLIEQGELIGFKPLESLAKYIDLNELKHIKFSSLQSSLEIKNKIISLPKTSIKSTALNMELWGKHTFDNQIDYHIQLLISELLAKKPRSNKNFDEELSLVENDSENRRSVFILMTGPIDNPIIKYDRKGAKQKIKEDIQQEKQTIKQLLKEEFGLFKKDTIHSNNKNPLKSDQKFQIKVGDTDSKKDNSKQPKKNEVDDDDF